MWIRATYPRLRLDQIMAVCWKFLMPLSIINLIAVTLEVYFLRDGSGGLSTADLWIMAGINIVVAAVSIAVFGRLIKEKVRYAPAGANPVGLSVATPAGGAASAGAD